MGHHRLAAGLTALILIGTACSAGTEQVDPTPETTVDQVPATEAGRDERILRPTETDDPFDLTGGAQSPEDTSVNSGSIDQVPDRVEQLVRVWETDWSRTTIDQSELIAGIGTPDPRDVIPPIDVPQFESPEAAADWLAPNEPGALVEFNGDARFYPLSIMTRHEIVNDRFGDIPVAVTFCPLCNTALAFDRRIDGEALRLGVSGLLRRSDMVMWDDASDSLWQQITGEGIVGRFAGAELDLISTQVVSFQQFADNFPDGWSLSQTTGFPIEYGANPYAGYSSSTTPFLFDGEPDPRFPALERVVGVVTDEADRSFPFSTLQDEVVVNDTVGSTPVVVWWAPGTTDALDQTSIADSRAIGTAVAYSRRLSDGTELTFTPSSADGMYTDDQTGSTWTLFGLATAGDLAGTQLEPVSHRNEFWFAWASFFPEGSVYE